MNPPPGIARVLLVEDEKLLRSLMRHVLETDGQFEIVGEAANRDEALAHAAHLQPDLILLDLHLGEDCAVEFLPQLGKIAPDANILLVTASDDPDLLQAAIQAGARGIVLKDASSDTLMKAIKKVCAGEIWLDRMFTTKLIEDITLGGNRPSRHPDRAKLNTLTEREKQISDLVCCGLTNKAIAEKLFIAEITVRHHLTSIFAKLGVPDRLSLVIFLHRLSPNLSRK